ncbi:MAG: FprA family A-type flavoprotein [Clostridia bacterium]|nr:FprA family A-type flavoprotein [Clostridia bacterium]
MDITKDIKYIGVNDRKTDLFESQYKIPNGVAYNSYIIIDEKIAVMDSVEKDFGDEWLDKIKNELGQKHPDYLIVQHMEPDHSANISKFADRYPEAQIVASAKAFGMMKNFFGTDFSDRRIVVGEGDTLTLGEHILTFVTAPMVHWPEVIVTYDAKDKVLFSADAFGKFGALDADEPWEDEARRYYIGIVGKYGAQVQALLDKAKALDIQKILPLHGPVLSEKLGYYVSLYDKWSKYEVEEKGVVIAYTSIYGGTKKAVELLAEGLRENGEKVTIYDLARDDFFAAVSDAFRFDRLVLATTTYNGDMFPDMRRFIFALIERGFKNRKVALIENGSWGPVAARKMTAMFEGSFGIEFALNPVKILSALNDDSRAQLENLKYELLQ